MTNQKPHFLQTKPHQRPRRIRSDKNQDLLSAFEFWLAASWPGLWTPEVRFTTNRNWSLDYANDTNRIAIEVEGVTYQGGRHQKKKTFEEDCKKYATAEIAGWHVLRITYPMLKSGLACDLIETVMRKNDEKIRSSEQDRQPPKTGGLVLPPRVAPKPRNQSPIPDTNRQRHYTP